MKYSFVPGLRQGRFNFSIKTYNYSLRYWLQYKVRYYVLVYHTSMRRALGPIRNRKTGQKIPQNRNTGRKIAENRKTGDFECKNRKTDLESDQNRETEKPNATLIYYVRMQAINGKATRNLNVLSLRRI